MYNRYIRNDRGTYTRITEDDGTPRRPSSHHAPPPPNPEASRPPPPPPETPHRPPPPPEMPEPPIQNGFLRHLLNWENIDTGDLLLLCLLFLLYREGADEELLVALGLLLIL